jgi:hypothetical protein
MKSFRFSILATSLLVGAALFVLFQHDSLQAQGRLPRSFAWEYKIIRTGVGGEDKNLQEAGAQGWECVGFAFNTNAGTTNGACFVLKRPKVGR